jgi:ribosomal protein S18 acetylase RimI-like enzyme
VSLPGAPDVVAFRDAVRPEDADAVERLVRATGFFSPAEVAIARELVDERLARGPASGYELLLAEAAAGLAGYTCYGPIPGTASSYDLYWVAVAPDHQGLGLGRALLARTEALVRAAGGTRVYAETSGRGQYAPTRAFYRACGYLEQARLPDFYAPGDDKLVFVKVLAA